MNEKRESTYEDCLQRFMGNAKFGYAHIDFILVSEPLFDKLCCEPSLSKQGSRQLLETAKEFEYKLPYYHALMLGYRVLISTGFENNYDFANVLFKERPDAYHLGLISAAMAPFAYTSPSTSSIS